MPDLYWAVAYYPYPPTDIEASINNGIEISWITPKYTERGWPFASSNCSKDSYGWPLLDNNGREVGEPLYAREIKKYHIWRSPDGLSAWEEIGAVDAEYSSTYIEDPDMFMLHPVVNGHKVDNSNKIFFTDNPDDGTYYYAITSEEHSGLESDELSEILEVTVSSGSISSSVIAHEKGTKNFWTTPPPLPSNFQYEATNVEGHYLLTWDEPVDDKIRYYNIYYSTGSDPSINQNSRIASVPVGTTEYLDWLAKAGAHYIITSVDRYGNESTTDGITEEEIDDIENISINIYPNPTNDIIEIDLADNKINKICVIDMSGKKIIERIPVAQKEKLDLSDFASGSYIVTFEADDEIYISKIIKE